MRDFLITLAVAAMPALGSFAGGLAAEAMQVSGLTLSRALHAAAGIVFAVVGIELMPKALQMDSPWIAVVSFVGGGFFAVSLDRVTDYVRHRTGKGEGKAGPWMIYVGVAVDLFSDGIMIGTGASISLGLGLLLGLGQVPADVPEGFATLASFRQKVSSRTRRLMIAASFIVPIYLGTTLGYFAVRGQPEWVKLALLAFTAGILLTVAVEEMIAQAHEATAKRKESDPLEKVILVSGFGLFALLTSYLG